MHRLELKLHRTTVARAISARAATADGSLSTSLSTAEVRSASQQLVREMRAALRVRDEDVYMVESRASFGFVILDLAPSLSSPLVSALEMRAATKPCAPLSLVKRWITQRAEVSICERLSSGALTAALDLSAGVLAEQHATTWVQLTPSLVRVEGVRVEQTADARGGARGGSTALLLLCLVVLAPIAVALASSSSAIALSARTAVAAAADASAYLLLRAIHTAEAFLVRILPPEVGEWWLYTGRPACQAFAHAVQEAARERWRPAAASAANAVMGAAARGMDRVRGRWGTTRMARVAPGSQSIPTSVEDEGRPEDEAFEAEIVLEHELDDVGDGDEGRNKGPTDKVDTFDID